MSLFEDLKSCALSRGADYFGIADLAPAHAFILAQGGEQIARYPRAVSVGIALLDPLVDLLPDREDFAAAMLYRHNSYDVVNLTLDQIALAAANTLQRAGSGHFPCRPQNGPATKRSQGQFPINWPRISPALAGSAKVSLLVTPDHGPRVRWVTVLTDAPLEPTGSPMEQRCGKCTQCTDVCPEKAITGRAFREDEPREARFDAAACDRYFRGLEKARGIGVCGMCLYICPYGRKSRVRMNPGTRGMQKEEREKGKLF